MNINDDPTMAPGHDNTQVLGLDFHNPVFPISALAIIAFVLYALVYPDAANTQLTAARGWSIEHFDWLFMIVGNIFVGLCLVLIVLPLGRIRLGGQDARPDHSLVSWFSMLFAAGMGIGLMFWSVAEPVAYYTEWYGTPLNAAAGTPQGARAAMGATMFHWGLHPWAIYGVVGLSLAFFAYNRGLPLSLRSAFTPLLGNRVRGWSGHLIDITAVLATIFGLATSLGFGASQAAGGLNYLFDVPNTLGTQIAIIIAVTAVALFSVWRGIDGGVKLFSNINMVIALLLLLFVVLTGSTLLFLNGLWDTTLAYLTHIVPLSNWIGRDDTTWFHGWTVFYWAWWISWSPFVGMFIARVSRGRTVREFLTAVLLVPTLVTIVWMSAFGGNALAQSAAGVGELANGISDVSLAMFQMLEQLPLTTLTSTMAIVLVLVFFITSSDSGSLVIDSITAGGKVDAPRTQRVFWATLEGVIAGVLLYGGGDKALGALQAGAVATGLPFSLVLLVMCVGLVKSLRQEHRDLVLASAI
ncbi:BCCT family betaine/carnitine transporter [Halomonas fontilapidosi]|uniref:BCCT family betaine/carnitine transporter n=1 Tax=Halomonas fontilapidosi TaxID=616675 RepID=A0A7W5GZM7_9GAMM|nr:BCCT family transporter [Halomonas fontilapidosi]MBB3185613.1 BCCT family betaine/carnitine transporter [Halomonas fontilapidosi]